MKQNVAVVGLQWGDEGKGKIVDILSRDFDCVARYQGGHNAGHTVRFRDRHYVLHLIPSGIFHDNVTCVIGNGVVLDPLAFLEETSMLEAAGIAFANRLLVSNRCHVIFPYHRAVESATEDYLGDTKIGTTLRGIGPAYEDKAGRRGLRMCDMMNTETLEEKIVAAVELKNRTLEAFRQPALSAADIREFCKTYRAYAERIAPFVVDSAAFLNQCIRDGKSLLLEGAQATLLDVDHGTYPFVTSSNASAGGIASGLGIAPRHVHGVVGITKAYTTRVGTGPFPTEAAREHDELLRSRGVEYGATTGRPRRCGWFDGPGGRYAAMLNGLESLVVTKVDVLDAFAEIPVCVEYKYKGSVLKEFPAEAAVLAHVKPVYKTLRGWQTSTLGIQEWSQMPQAAQDYLKFLSDYLGAPLRMISTGPTRDQTIVL